MFQRIRKLFAERAIIRLTTIFVLTVIAYAIVSFWKWHELPPQVPLFYSLPRGEEQLASPSYLFLLPGCSIAFFGINSYIASRLYPKERLAGIFLVLLGTITSLLLLITFVKIIFLIT